MKTLKKLFNTIICSIIILGACVTHYLLVGQPKSAEKLASGKELTLYECCCIYLVHTSAWLFGWILSPEAADQCFLMSFAKEGSVHVRRGRFEDSTIFIEQSSNNSCPFTLNYPTNIITSDKNSKFRKELKYALAYDGATCIKDDNHSIPLYELHLDVKYDKYHSIYKLGPFTLNFYWELFSYIQERGWIHKCKIYYIGR